VEELWQRSPGARRFQGIVVRAEALLAELTGEPQARLQQSLDELTAALGTGDPLAIEAAGLRLTCLVVDLEKGE
jgi:hypothetical protein